jgi:hypothetical protein
MVHAKDADRFIRGDVLVGHVELGDAKQKTTIGVMEMKLMMIESRCRRRYGFMTTTNSLLNGLSFDVGPTNHKSLTVALAVGHQPSHNMLHPLPSLFGPIKQLLTVDCNQYNGEIVT